MSGFTEPVFDYPHGNPGEGKAHGCSITGGYVVRDPSLGDLYGRYVYADFCVGEIRSMLLPANAGGLAGGDRSEGLNVTNPVSFGEDSCGRLYAIAQAGTVYRFQGAAPPACSSSPATRPVAPIGTEPPPPRLLLSVRRHRLGGKLKLLLTIRLAPCEGNAGERVQLRRGGRGAGTKNLNRSCVARFRLRVSHSSTFRALLPSGDYRSQVRTIALAKPSP